MLEPYRTSFGPSSDLDNMGLSSAPRRSEWVAGFRQLEAQASADVGHRGEHWRIRERLLPFPAPFLPIWTNANGLQTDVFARSPARISLSAGVLGGGTSGQPANVPAPR
jgi:hypothetical protein